MGTHDVGLAREWQFGHEQTPVYFTPKTIERKFRPASVDSGCSEQCRGRIPRNVLQHGADQLGHRAYSSRRHAKQEGYWKKISMGCGQRTAVRRILYSSRCGQIRKRDVLKWPNHL